MTTNPNLTALSEAGVSIWLDDLSRGRINSGNLAELIEKQAVVGVTSNPTIFAKALSNAADYNDKVRELAARGASVDEAVRELITSDVRDAADVFRNVYESTGKVDGRVSLEVDPRLAHDTDRTVAEAVDLWKAVDRPNLMVKIPATVEGLPAITRVLAEGVSVNVTLIFSVQRYREVMDAFLAGLEQAKYNGHDVSQIFSVASFFVSRVDTEIDKRLEGVTGGEALRGKAAIANARLAYAAYQEVFASDRWKALEAAGAKAQRPLWASTGVKDPSLPDTLYVTGLVAPNTVNTMPEKTLEATFDHAEVTGDTVTGTYAESNELLDRIAGVGISYDEVVAQLEAEGLTKFEDSWAELLDTVRAALDNAR